MAEYCSVTDANNPDGGNPDTDLDSPSGIHEDIKIGALMMVKNETKRILTSLESISHLDGLFIYDTGSTDDTVELITRFCDDHDITHHIKHGVFEDFATSRNILHDFADSFDHDFSHYLLLDCNDELKGDLKAELSKSVCKDSDYFLVQQQWKTGPTTINKYFNLRVMKAKTGSRYKGVVHEYIVTPPGKTKYKLEDVHIFQDRTLDDGKSAIRWKRDLQLLQGEHEKEPDEPRILFYLAQTYSCLNDKGNAFKAYKKRSAMVHGFYEERFQAMLKCAELSDEWDEKHKWCLKAFEIIERAEPLIIIAEHYRDKKQSKMAYIHAKLACDLAYPSQCLLYVDQNTYDYKRWHLLGIVGFYAGYYEEGERACINAVINSQLKVDIDNLKFYIDKRKV